MFKNVDYSESIPPNFIQSILTNPSLYKMFKDEFETNLEYFQNIKKEVYLSKMLDFICDTLFSSNVFHIYQELEDLESITKGKLDFMKRFYDDFLLDVFKEDPTNILKTKLFKGFEYAKKNDIYAPRTSEFINLYDYIFHESVDYFAIVEVLIKEPLYYLKKRETLSLKDFDILCNYIKNNTSEYISPEIIDGMLYNHAYKKNHIFDIEVAQIIARSIAVSYLNSYGVECKIEYRQVIENGNLSNHSLDEHIIEIDNSLVESFCSLNYIELFENIFYEADILRDASLLKSDKVSVATLNVIMNLTVLGVDMDRIFVDPNYLPYDYEADLRSSCFIKTLRFFSSLGVNLFDNYIESKFATLKIDYEDYGEIHSKKEISLDQRFNFKISKLKDRSKLITKFAVLKLIYSKEGSRKKTLEIIKNLASSKENDFLTEYLHSRIIEPEAMIDDVRDLSFYKTKNREVETLIERELKYIYVDTFQYSLDSFLKLDEKIKKEDFLEDLLVKVSCIKDTPITHRFIDEATSVIVCAQNRP